MSNYVCAVAYVSLLTIAVFNTVAYLKRLGKLRNMCLLGFYAFTILLSMARAAYFILKCIDEGAQLTYWNAYIYLNMIGIFSKAELGIIMTLAMLELSVQVRVTARKTPLEKSRSILLAMKIGAAFCLVLYACIGFYMAHIQANQFDVVARHG